MFSEKTYLSKRELCHCVRNRVGGTRQVSSPFQGHVKREFKVNNEHNILYMVLVRGSKLEYLEKTYVHGENM